MGRFWLGVSLLAALLGIGLWGAAAMDAVHEPISQTLEEAAQQCLAGNFQEGVALARQARQSWDSHWHGTASVADHAPMDEIDGLFAQLDAYAQTENTEDFAAYCGRLSNLIHAVGEAHSLNWWNLL